MNCNQCDAYDISVIVPLYHWRRTDYINSILKIVEENAKTGKMLKIELVLVNDSPEEGVLPRLGRNPGFTVRYVENRYNLGIQKSRIAGLEVSSGQYILFLDQDDEITKDAIVELYRTLENARKAGGNGANLVAVSQWNSESFDRRKQSIRKVRNKARLNDFRSLTVGGNYIGPPGHCLLQKEAIPECWKCMILKNQGADDYLLWLCILLSGGKFVRCGKMLYTHKHHQECFSKNQEAMFQSEREAFEDVAEEFHIKRSIYQKYLSCLKFRRDCYALRKANAGIGKMLVFGICHPIHLIRSRWKWFLQRGLS